MSKTFLEKILDHKREQIAIKKPYYEILKKNITQTEYVRYSVFKNQISRPGQINLIAEIKKASPSKGLICADFDVLKLADLYQSNGAAAFSVLTEEKYFLGSFRYLKMVTDEYKLPALTKDFIIDEGQIFEAFCNGASAILLIVAILTDDQLVRLMAAANHLDLDVLVEVHDQRELDRALSCGADIIGINNRNLSTFEVDITTALQLKPQIPSGIITVAESGLSTHDDIAALRAAGFNAVLIGETFLKADDVAAKIKEVMYDRKS